ncbi:hypothetical protein AgCh_035911 [Apium graveolens]
MGIRKVLHPVRIGDSNQYEIRAAIFDMTKKEKELFCCFFQNVKLPHGTASNISRCVQMGTSKPEVAVALMRLSAFFRGLCGKVIEVEDILKSQEEIIEILCRLETIFPPAIFDMMVHLPVHLCKELEFGGPVHHRWMFGIERYLSKLKSYVRNRSKSEGSIAEGYLAEECVTFCFRFLSDSIKTKIDQKINVGYSIGSGRNRDGKSVELAERVWIKIHELNNRTNQDLLKLGLTGSQDSISELKRYSVNIHTVKIQTIMSEETQTPTKPTKTQEIKNTQTNRRYKTIRVPIPRPSEYPICKVKMAIFLEARDPEYLDRINEGPYKPTMLSVAVANQPAKSIPREKGYYTLEDISSIAKDERVGHLLHSAIDNVMSNRVIHCKIAKVIWDALETRCQGTDTIKKNRRTILTQEYEHFDLNVDELLTDLYDRDNYDLTETTLDEIYVVASKRGKGKALIIKSDSESSYSDDDYDSETESLPEIDVDEEMMQLCALTVKGITKIAYRKFRKGKKFSSKSGSSNKKGFRKSEGQGGKSDRGDNSNVKCYNYGERGHISPDCKKGKSDNG